MIAKWLASGVLEYVAWDDSMPILLQPCIAVPKGSAPFYRLITDASFANKLYSNWGVTYTTAAQLSSTLNRCDFHFSVDISNTYHLALMAGCCGELSQIRRPVITVTSRGPGQPNKVTWIDALVNWCTPSTCQCGCDKELPVSGILIDCFVFRFCQFGQKTVGIPLGCLVSTVACFLSRLMRPVHVASWVDDLIFVMSTPEDGECACFESYCEVCWEYYCHALKVQELLQAKARALNIPLSAKDHAVGQRGAFTWLVIGTHKRRFHMLPEKLASMFSARDDLAAAALSTWRIIVRVRGKALHYCCAIQFIAVAAPSLLQLMHNRETCTGLVAVPTLEEMKVTVFDWDRELRVSERALRALEFMRTAMEK